MKNIEIAIRSLLKKGRHNIMKITSLGIGLAVGLVLIAKVWFEQSYDSFYPDNDRVYQLWETYQQGNGEPRAYPQTSGGIAPTMLSQIPEIELATRFTYCGGTIRMTDTQDKYEGQMIFADSCLFDVLPRPILRGDAKEVLSRPMYAMVSDRIAKNIGGDVVGRSFEWTDAPGRVLTIGGVFKEVPENADRRYDIILSMPSAGRFMWAGSPTNMLGNDRYVSYVKLRPGVDPASLDQPIQTFIHTFFPPEKQEKAGVAFQLSLHNIAELHKSDPQVVRMTWILSLLAFALIFTAVMNYVLIVISSIVNRAKEVAVRKCYGASAGEIHGMMFAEALVHLVLSLLLALALILAFRGTVEELLATSLSALLLSKSCVLLLAISLLVFFIAGFLPGSIYARIPIAAAFRNYRENKRVWKKGLLMVQIVATAFLVTMLVFVARQYTFMVNDRPGYDSDHLAYCAMTATDSTARTKAIEEVSRIPEVAAVTTAFQLPFYTCSGNNVFLPGTDRELFNIADLYWVGDGYLQMMGIPVVQGRSFTEGVENSREVMVDRRFVERMKTVAGWTDVVGRTISVSEHSDKGEEYTICGVYENFRIGSISAEENRPSVLFYSKRPQYNLFVKFHRMSPEGLAKVQETITRLYPDKELYVNTFRSQMLESYTSARQFRDAVMIGGAVALLITLIGLIGYTTDEVNRRRKEIAVRRVNGATVGDVLRLFSMDVLYIAPYAIVIGSAAAYFVVQKWQEQFSEKVALSWYIFLGCAMAVLVVLCAVVLLNVRKAASENPVNNLKSE